VTNSERPSIPSLPEPIVRAVELTVYAPIGVAAYALEVAPDVVRTVVARGRAEVDLRQEQVAGRVRHFKGAGQVAIAFGLPVLRRKVGKRLAALRPDTAPPAPAKRPPAARPTTPAAPTPSPTPAASSNGHHVDRVEPVGAADTGVTIDLSREGPGAASESVESEARLAIPGYDALSASQVVERLAGLSGEELAAVRHYETGHRRRRTILGKIEQLSA
jgi:hypothetical protein